MRVLVYSVSEVRVSVEQETGGKSLKIEAKGMVNTGGWSGGELSPWMYIAPPADGILDLSFTAEPPRPGTMVTEAFASIPASLQLPIPDWVLGVRVHSSTNSETAMLPETSASVVTASVQTPDDGMPLPWPFPWFRPHAA